MRRKLTSIDDALARVRPGSTIALGGALLRRQPMALVRGLVRHGIGDLTVLGWASTTATDLLAGAGLLKRYEGIYVGLFWHGTARNFRRAVEAGRVEVRDFSESAMVQRLRAGGTGLSFLPTKALLGTDMARRNPDQVRELACPFTDDRYHALAAARADVALIHGYVADEYGNVQMPVVRDTDDIDQHLAKAADRVIVTVERIVPHEAICRRPALTYIPASWVEAVVEAPYGAHPSACDGFYDEDEDHLQAWIEASRTTDGFDAYVERHVRATGSEAGYQATIGGMDRLRTLDVEPVETWS